MCKKSGLTLIEMPAVRKPRREALTLIELLAALAIVSVLTAGAFRVTGQLSRSGKVIQARQDSSTLETGLKNLLAADVHHADRYKSDVSKLSFEMHASLDAKTLEIRHIPSNVTYEIRSFEGRNWLVRTQKLTNLPLHTELVCPDVSKIVLKDSGGRSSTRRGWKAMPDKTTIEIHFENSHRPELRFQYRLR